MHLLSALDYLVKGAILALTIAVLSLFCAGNLTAQEEYSNYGFGPPGLRNQYPLSVLHLSLAPASPRILEEGAYRIKLNTAWTNDFIAEPEYTVDAESRMLVLGFDYGVAPNFELGIDIPILWRGGGVLDSFIDSWHRAFGLPRGSRDLVANNQYEISGSNTDGSTFDLESSGTRLGNIELGARYLLSEGSKTLPAWSLQMVGSLPTASSGFGHQGLDISTGILGSKRWGKSVAYLGLAHLYYSDTKVDGVRFERHHLQGFLGLEYLIHRSVALYLGLYGSSRILRVADHPAYALYLDMGGKIRIADDSYLELLLRENPAPGEGTSDVTFYAGLVREFR